MFKCSPVLKPDLHDAHVQAGVLAQLLSHVARRFGAVVVGGLEGLQLLGRDGGARPLVGLVALQGAVCNTQGYTEVTRGHTRSPEVNRNHTRSPEVTQGHTRSPEITQGHQRLHRVTRGHTRSIEVN